MEKNNNSDSFWEISMLACLCDGPCTSVEHKYEEN